MLNGFETTISEQYKNHIKNSIESFPKPNYSYLEKKVECFRNIMIIFNELLKNKIFIQKLYSNFNELFEKEQKFISKIVHSSRETCETMSVPDTIKNNLFIFKENIKICLPFLIDDFFTQFKKNWILDDSFEKICQVSYTEGEGKKIGDIESKVLKEPKKELNLSLLSGSNERAISNCMRSDGEISLQEENNIKIYSEYSVSPKVRKRINILQKINKSRSTSPIKKKTLNIPELNDKKKMSVTEGSYFDVSRSLGFRSKKRKNFTERDSRSVNVLPELIENDIDILPGSGNLIISKDIVNKYSSRRLFQKSNKNLSGFVSSKNLSKEFVSNAKETENSKKTINNKKINLPNGFKNLNMYSNRTAKANLIKSTFSKIQRRKIKNLKKKTDSAVRSGKLPWPKNSLIKKGFIHTRQLNSSSNQSIYKKEIADIRKNSSNYDVFIQKKLKKQKSLFKSKNRIKKPVYLKSKTGKSAKKNIKNKKKEIQNLRRSLVQQKSMKNNLFGIKTKNILSVNQKKREANHLPLKFHFEVPENKNFLKSKTIFSFKAKKNRNEVEKKNNLE